MSSGPESLVVWANIAFRDEIEDALREWRERGLKLPKMTCRVNEHVQEFWLARDKAPPRPIHSRSVGRWCEQAGIYVPRWDDEDD